MSVISLHLSYRERKTSIVIHLICPTLHLSYNSFVLHFICPTERGKHNLFYISFVLHFIFPIHLICRSLYWCYSLFVLHFVSPIERGKDHLSYISFVLRIIKIILKILFYQWKSANYFCRISQLSLRDLIKGKLLDATRGGQLLVDPQHSMFTKVNTKCRAHEV